MPTEKIKSRNYKKDRMILQLDTERGRGAAWAACQPGALARSGSCDQRSINSASPVFKGVGSSMLKCSRSR